MTIEWKSEQTHPLLILDESDLCIRLQPIEQEYGGNLSIKYQMEVSLAHAYGSVIYRTIFLSLTLNSLKELAKRLNQMNDKPSHAIEFSDLSQEFILRIVTQGRGCQIFLDLKSFGTAEVSLNTNVSKGDFSHLWGRHLNEHCKQMVQWTIENPPVGPV